MDSKLTLAFVGNPNCGKTTIFNAITGSNYSVGNWPGVTVEKKSAIIKYGEKSLTAVDLPGIYSFLATTDDERVSRNYLDSGEVGLVVNILDATNLERNLFLTMQLLEFGIPMVLVVNMLDLAQLNSISIDLEALSRMTGCPVLGINAKNSHDIKKLHDYLVEAVETRSPPRVNIDYPPSVRSLIKKLQPALEASPNKKGISAEACAIKIIEGDQYFRLKLSAEKDAAVLAEIDAGVAAIEAESKEKIDILAIQARSRLIKHLLKMSYKQIKSPGATSEKIDKIVLNPWLALPIFLVIMYIIFWVTMNVGASFQDFFDQAAGTIFVTSVSHLLNIIHSPQWLTIIIAQGIGAGLQTASTFIPIIFMMFFMISILEDTGYMARAAYITDKYMRMVGLPGKAFVSLLLGFGCNVSAMMATRTLEARRDRYLAIFMNPLMSCSARLPVYALFSAAFFGAYAGIAIFSLYFIGIFIALLTGLLLRKTLFKGENSGFVMELPSYHLPQIQHIVHYSWSRLLHFLSRTKFIIVIVTGLALLNSINTDFSWGQRSDKHSLLAGAGMVLTPVFTPFGVQKENWPASVGLLTGIVAKETVVTTLTSIYSQMDNVANTAAANQQVTQGSPSPSEAQLLVTDFTTGMKSALLTIPTNLKGVAQRFIDPLSLGQNLIDPNRVDQSTVSVLTSLRRHFSEGWQQAFAYLLFVLIYFPCVMTVITMTKEVGPQYAAIAAIYLAVLGWSIATLFYQISYGHSVLWIVVAVLFLLAIVRAMAYAGNPNRKFGKRKFVPMQVRGVDRNRH